MFDDVVAERYRLVYYVDEDQQNILLVKIRRRQA
jgi:mRNA-degrading endonuclease RelE of RelBE toxin-antitoxin system